MNGSAYLCIYAAGIYSIGEGVFQVKKWGYVWHGVDLDAVPGAHVILTNIVVETTFDSVMKSFFPSAIDLAAIKANNDKR